MPESLPDYYAALGLPRDASAEEIKRAYHEAAHRFHPDKNKLPGETEIFLEVQQAYEVLYNPRRRAQYDATLPRQDEPSPAVLHEVFFSRPNLVRLNEPQMIYLLLEVSPRVATSEIPSPPLNVCLVLDCSTSMQGEKLDLLKSAASQLLGTLRDEDILSVVAFSDKAEVIIPASFQRDRKQSQARIQMIHTSGATEMYQGLKAGFQEVRRGFDPGRVNHIVLLTDGHTYGDEDACLQLAQEASSYNIGISGLGIGTEWNDVFLDRLASRTGGSSGYIAKPQDIQPILSEKFKALATIFASDVVLDLAPAEGIDLSYVFRIQPEGAPIPPEESMSLGPILQNMPLGVLFEFVVHPSALEGDSVTLLNGSLSVSVASRPRPVPPIRLRLAREVEPSPTDDLPPTRILRALSRLTLYRLQEKASFEAEAGRFDHATRALRNLAANLLAEGEQGLAHTALLEAENLERRQVWSAEGGKEIKYGTRSLLLPGMRE
ncbi:MAG: DnaJ domain-containing protein [Bacteroidota bacterium]